MEQINDNASSMRSEDSPIVGLSSSLQLPLNTADNAVPAVTPRSSVFLNPDGDKRRTVQLADLETKYSQFYDSQQDAPEYKDLLGQCFCIGYAGDSGDPATMDFEDAIPSTVRLLLLYFSGRWCPLCQSFDDVMLDVHQGLKALSADDGPGIELVFVSCDVSEPAYKSHLQGLSGIFAVEWSSANLDDIMQHFNVEGVPALLVLDARDGSVLSKVGREDVLDRYNKDGAAAACTGAPNRNENEAAGLPVPARPTFNRSLARGMTKVFEGGCGANAMYEHWVKLLEEKDDVNKRSEMFCAPSDASEKFDEDLEDVGS